MAGNALQIAISSLFATSTADVDALDLDRDESFTAAAWVKPNSKTPVSSKMSGSAGNYRGWWLLVELNETLEFLLRSTNNPKKYIWMVAGGSVPDGTWSHVAVIFDYDAADPARCVKFYVNGEAVSATLKDSSSQGLEEEPALPTKSTAAFNINARDNTTGSTFFYGGLYDEMAVWKRVLSPSEIQRLFNPVPEPGYLAVLAGLLVALGVVRLGR